MNNSIAIQFSQVVKNYPDVQALKNINFNIEEGSFFGLLGPNGAGKSTLINILAGLVRASEGSVSVFGNDVVHDYRQTRRDLGLVPQELISDGFFSVIDLLRLQAGYFGFGRRQYDWIDELLDILALTGKADTLTANLSGGMKRRVLIAQALVHKPKIIILDEPTAGVDIDLRKTIWTFIRKLHKMGHTIILTTHYLEEAEQLCERIGIISDGRMIALDAKDELLNNGNNRLEKVYLDLVSEDRGKE